MNKKIQMKNSRRQPKKIPRIAFLPRHMTSWAELVPLAHYLKEKRLAQPIVILATSKLSARKDELGAKGIEYIDIIDKFAKCSPAVDQCFLNSGSAAREKFVSQVCFAFRYWTSLRKELQFAIDVLKQIEADVLVLPGDRELSPVPAFCRAANLIGIPSVISATSLPYIEGVSVPREGRTEFSVQRGEGAPLLNRIVANLYPKQVRDTPHGKMLFSPAWRFLALKLLGMASKKPWVQGGGASTYIIQHSQTKMKLYESLGCDPSKFVFVGDQTLDPVFRSIKSRGVVRKKLLAGVSQKEPDTPLYIMAVPNEAEHDLCSMEEHLSRQRQFWSVLAKHTSNVFLSLHPKSNQEDYADLAQEFDFKFLNIALSDVVGVADVFICSCSTTSYWAKIAGIPMINWDYLDLDMDMFRDQPGVFQVKTALEFAELMNGFDDKVNSVRELVSSRAEVLAKDALFDGEATPRIAQFICNLEKV